MFLHLVCKSNINFFFLVENEFFQRMKKTMFNNLRPKCFIVNNCFKVYGNTDSKRIDGHFKFLK